MIERKSMLEHGCVQRFLAGMTERRVSEIMHQRKRFGEIYIQRQRTGNRASNLSDLNGVSQTIAKVIGIAAGENLSLIFEAAKGSRVNDAVAVALKIVAIGMRRFRETAPAGVLYLNRVAGQHARSLAEAVLST